MNIYFTRKSIIKLDETSKSEALLKIAIYCQKLGIVDDSQKLFLKFQKRENEFFTGFENGFCILHARYSVIKFLAVLYCNFSKGIEWQSLDKKLAKYCFVILAPQNLGEEHLKILTQISKALINLKFQNQLNQATNLEKIYQQLNPLFKNIY